MKVTTATELPALTGVEPSIFIEQTWDAYTAEDHDGWGILYEKRMRELSRTGSRVFLGGAETIGLRRDRVADLDEVNALSDRCERRPFSLDAVISQPFEIDRFRDVLFVVDSFDQLFEAGDEAGRRLDR